MKAFLASLLAVLLPVGGAWAAPTPVSTCGETVEDGILTGDLDCSASTDFGVTVDRGGRFDLKGFTITAQRGIRCTSVCQLSSSLPGGALVGAVAPPATGTGIFIGGGRFTIDGLTVSGFESGGVLALNRTSGRVQNCNINDNGARGLSVINGTAKLVLVDTLVTDNGDIGVSGGGKVLCEGSTISSNVGSGIQSSSTKASLRRTECEITGNGGSGSLGFRRTKVARSTISGNGDCGIGIWYGGGATVVDSTVDGNRGDGISECGAVEPGAKAKLVNSSASGNGGSGVAGIRKVAVKASMVDGNAGSGLDLDGLAAGLALAKFTAGSTVNANGIFGATVGEAGGRTGRLVVVQSDLFGNGTDAECGVSIACADVAATVLPRLDSSSTCDNSYVLGSGLPGSNFGMCAEERQGASDGLRGWRG